jgi:Domain of unknown function (DUF4340)
MNKRLVISLVLLAGAGAGAAVVLTRKDPHAARSSVISTDKPPLAKIDPAKLDQLEITAAPEGAPPGPPVHVELKRKDPSSWSVAVPFGDTASPDAIQQVMEGLQLMVWKRQVADSMDAVGKLGCSSDKGIHVIARAGGAVVADLFICAELERARLASDSKIWEVEGLDRWRFAKAAARDWRYLLMLELPADQIATVGLHSAGGDMVVARRPPPPPGSDAGPVAPGDLWQVESSSTTPPLLAIDQSVFEGLVGRLARLTAIDVIEGVSDADAGLAPPAAWIEVKNVGGGSVKLLVGKPAPAGAPGQPEAVYVRKDGDTRLYTLAKDAAGDLGRSPLELQSRALAGFAPGTLTALKVTAGGVDAGFSKSDKGWTGGAFDMTKVASLAGQLEGLTASGIASPQPSLKDAGLTAPAAVIVLGDATKRRVTLRVGAQKDASRYVVRDGNATVFLVDAASLASALKPAEALH